MGLKVTFFFGCVNETNHNKIQMYFLSLHTLSACCHITNEEAMKTFAFIKDNFTSDIQLYMKNGLLGEAQNGPADCENWAANELFERAERKQNLKKALLDLATEWPPIVEEGNLVG